MGIFDFFKKKKEISEETRRDFLNKILSKYFEGSKSKLESDASELLEITKYNISKSEMTILLVRCLGFRELNAKWNTDIANTLKQDCLNKIPEAELKWLMVYCDLHYINKDPKKEALLIFELAGRQMGMPSPSGDISSNYNFK